MATQIKTPSSVATLARATRFQRSKQILTIALQWIGAIFSMYATCMVALLPLMAAVLAQLAVEVWK